MKRSKYLKRSYVRWIGVTIAPWSLALGLVTNFAAQAGQEITFSASAYSQAAVTPDTSVDLVGIPSYETRLVLTNKTKMLELANLIVPNAKDLLQIPEDLGQTPRINFKLATYEEYESRQSSPITSNINRKLQGDPVVALHPSLKTLLLEPQLFEQIREQQLFYDNEVQIAASFTVDDDEGANIDSINRFEPWAEDTSPNPMTPNTATMANASQSTLASSKNADGATPKVSASETLSSTTPAMLETMPIEIVALSPLARALASGAQPDYAALIDPDHMAKERKCLAEAIYFEARGESIEGQAAVAQVVLNRVKSGLYPPTVCGVVYQNRSHHNACQFSFTCDGHALRVNETEPWQLASQIAERVLEGETYIQDVGAATHYHANYVKPRWSRRLIKMDVIGRHIFYKLHDGQT